MVRDVLEWLYYNIKWKSKSAFAQMESERKRFGSLKEEQKCSDSSVVRDKVDIGDPAYIIVK